jgi:class 3 adenylate cyclase
MQFLIFNLLFICFISTRAIGEISPVTVPGKGAPADVELIEFVDASPNTDQVSELKHVLQAAPISMRPAESSQFFRGGRLWYRVQIKNPEKQTQDLVLLSAFPTYSQWVLSTNSEGQPFLNKSGFAEAENALGRLQATIQLSVPPGTSTYYLGTLSHQIPFFPVMKLWHLEDYNDNQIERSSIVLTGAGAYVMALVSVFLFTIWLRSFMFIKLVFAGIAYFPLILLLNGQAYLLPLTLRRGMIESWFVLTVLTMSLIIVFGLEFNGINRKRNPIATHALNGFLVLPLVCLPFYLYESFSASLFYLAASALALGLIQIVAIKRALYEHDRDSVFYAASFLPITIADCLVLAEFTGLIPFDSRYVDLQFFFIGMQSLLITIPMGMKVTEMRQNIAILRRHLKGIIADDRIDDVATMGPNLLREPIHEYVTILFVDIVGYSLIFERMNSTEAFYSLRKVMSEMTQIVHRYGGVVDKSLGDGILAFFGYDLIGKTVQGHEGAALLCARDLQQHAAASGLRDGGTVFPLRVGINSAKINIGNLGDEDRLDLTIAGSGVVLASRFEGACEPFKVILGESTYFALSPELINGGGFSRILLPVKHQSSLNAAYEYDPLIDQGNLALEALERYRQQNQFMVQHARYPVQEDFVIRTSYGRMQLVNFSVGGFGLLSNVHLSRGVPVEIFFDLPAEHPATTWLSSVSAEVVWSAVRGDGRFLHGLRVSGRNLEQNEVIFKLVEELIGAIGLKPRDQIGA